MKKIITAVLLSFAATTAIAQTNATPPEVAPAGDPGKLSFKKPMSSTSSSSSTMAPNSTMAAAPKTAAERRAARKAKRAAKVGDKPLN